MSIENDEVSVKPRVVALVGTAPSSRMRANEQGPDVEIWALNDCYTFLTHWDRWFEIHGKDVWIADGKDHVEFLKSIQVPVYMIQHYPEIPNSVRYPMEDITELFFPGAKHAYLASSIDYMMALAIAEGVDEIKLYGVNMATSTEFLHQRPSCEFWMGIAMGRGIKVTLPEDSPMLQAPLYGPSKRQFIDRQVIETRLGRVHFQKAQVEAQLNAVHGAEQALSLVLSLFEDALPEDAVAEVDQPVAVYQPPDLGNINKNVGDDKMNAGNGLVEANVLS